MSEVVVDLSAWQYGLRLDELPTEVVGAIVKLSQDTFADGQGPDFRHQLRDDPRFVTRGWYHFLGPSPVQAQVDFFASVVGDPEPGESLWLDWENNAITGYQPPQSDAYDWLQIAEARWPGRVGWYSYRSNANTARQSGDFTLPLWLADPNVDGEKWAATLDACMLQWGQAAIAPINGTLHNVDCNDVINHHILDSLGGDTMTPEAYCKMRDPGFGTPDAIYQVVNGVIQIKLGDGDWYWLAQYDQYVHTEAQAAHNKPSTGGASGFNIALSGIATPK